MTATRHPGLDPRSACSLAVRATAPVDGRPRTRPAPSRCPPSPTSETAAIIADVLRAIVADPRQRRPLRLDPVPGFHRPLPNGRACPSAARPRRIHPPPVDGPRRHFRRERRQLGGGARSGARPARRHARPLPAGRPRRPRRRALPVGRSDRRQLRHRQRSAAPAACSNISKAAS